LFQGYGTTQGGWFRYGHGTGSLGAVAIRNGHRIGAGDKAFDLAVCVVHAVAPFISERGLTPNNGYFCLARGFPGATDIRALDGTFQFAVFHNGQRAGGNRKGQKSKEYPKQGFSRCSFLHVSSVWWLMTAHKQAGVQVGSGACPCSGTEKSSSQGSQKSNFMVKSKGKICCAQEIYR
jgi:hypothetical protein